MVPHLRRGARARICAGIEPVTLAVTGDLKFGRIEAIVEGRRARNRRFDRVDTGVGCL
jgi:hypothetical protein